MVALRERFEGAANRSVLIGAIARQKVVAGDQTLAAAFADKGQLVAVNQGEKIITQGDWSTDCFFILAGEFEIDINGQRVATRGPEIHVGELAGLSAARARTATVRALSESLVLRISASDLNEIVGDNAAFWKAQSDSIADRLDERNEQLGSTNEHPRVFIISSTEQLPALRSLRTHLSGEDVHVYAWDSGTFAVSDYAISSIEDAIEASDFTVSIAGPDDQVAFRGAVTNAPRDNVSLEFGLSVGKIGRSRSILLVNTSQEVRLPSDTAGLTTIRFKGGSREELARTMPAAVDQIRDVIEREGVRRDRRAR